MKSVCFEHEAAAAADAAKVLWKRGEDAIATIVWSLARDDVMGTPIMPGSPIRLAVFDGAKSIGLPKIEYMFEIREHDVRIIDMEFSNS